MTLKPRLSNKHSLSSPDAPLSLPDSFGQSTVITKSVFALSIFCLTFLFALIAGSIILAPYASDATTASTSVDVIVDVGPVLSIRAIPNLIDLSLTPTPAGTEVHDELTVLVNTNNSTGYTLTMNAETNNTALVHTNTTNEILSTTSPTPASLPVNRWGYNLGTAATTFLRIPPLSTADTINSSTGPVIDHATIITLGTKIDSGSMAGLYSNILVFTATTNYVPPSGPCGTGDYECILFTIDTNDGTYSIPTSGRVVSMNNHVYDWDVYVDDVLTTDCPSGNCTGTSDYTSAGITLTDLSSGQHQIKILPHTSPSPGWGNAFGHGLGYVGANAQPNKDKLISIDAPLTTMAFSPKTTESTTNASYMFAQIFADCANLTTPATIMDTYKLPDTITDLYCFLCSIHEWNSKLTAPIDLSRMTNWLKNNNSITHMNGFLAGVHMLNDQLLTPIDLTPLSGWFYHNTSIIELETFLQYTFDSNYNLDTPIDLTPLANWFNANESVVVLAWFMLGTHELNDTLTTPVDLTPLAGWFNNNSSITDFEGFLAQAHLDNSQMLTPIDLTPLSSWFSNNRSFTGSIWYDGLRAFLSQTHDNNPNLTLSGQAILPNWVKTAKQGSTDIWNVNRTFEKTFYMGSTKAGDTGEPKFQDGTPLSSIGTPSTNNQAYTNRSGITPVNTNWK